MDPTKIGIYLKAAEGKLARVTSPYWLPPAPEWALVTNDPNVTLTEARDIIASRGLMKDPANVCWTALPLLEEGGSTGEDR